MIRELNYILHPLKHQTFFPDTGLRCVSYILPGL